jgi:hypothetical protein
MCTSTWDSNETENWMLSGKLKAEGIKKVLKERLGKKAGRKECGE